MSTPVTNPGIVVGVDGSPASKVAIYWAGQEAAMRNLPLTLVYVVNRMVPTWPQAAAPTEFNHWQKEQARLLFEDAVKTVSENTKGDRPVINCEASSTSPRMPS